MDFNDWQLKNIEINAAEGRDFYNVKHWHLPVSETTHKELLRPNQ